MKRIVCLLVTLVLSFLVVPISLAVTLNRWEEVRSFYEKAIAFDYETEERLKGCGGMDYPTLLYLRDALQLEESNESSYTESLFIWKDSYKYKKYNITDATLRCFEDISVTLRFDIGDDGYSRIVFSFPGEYKKDYESVECVEDTINFYTSIYGKPTFVKYPFYNNASMKWSTDQALGNTCELYLYNPTELSPFPQAYVILTYNNPRRINANE